MVPCQHIPYARRRTSESGEARRLRAERLVVIPDNLVQDLLLRSARTIDKGWERHGTVGRKDRAQRVVAMNG